VSGIRRCECGEHMLEDERHLHTRPTATLVPDALRRDHKVRIRFACTKSRCEWQRRRLRGIATRRDVRWRLPTSACPVHPLVPDDLAALPLRICVGDGRMVPADKCCVRIGRARRLPRRFGAPDSLLDEGAEPGGRNSSRSAACGRRRLRGRCRCSRWTHRGVRMDTEARRGTPRRRLVDRDRLALSFSRPRSQTRSRSSMIVR
jgi:hypothetical protein